MTTPTKVSEKRPNEGKDPDDLDLDDELDHQGSKGDKADDLPDDRGEQTVKHDLDHNTDRLSELDADRNRRERDGGE